MYSFSGLVVNTDVRCVRFDSTFYKFYACSCIVTWIEKNHESGVLVALVTWIEKNHESGVLVASVTWIEKNRKNGFLDV